MQETWRLPMCEKGRSEPCLASLQRSDIQTGPVSVNLSALAGHHPGFLVLVSFGKFKHNP